MSLALSKRGRCPLLALALGGALWVGGTGQSGATSRMTPEQVTLHGVAMQMGFWHMDQVPQPRTWKEVSALLEREAVDHPLNSALAKPVSSAGYRLVDRYVFPTVPLRMGKGRVSEMRDTYIVLMRNVPLASAAGPWRQPDLHRELIVRRLDDSNEMRFFRTTMEEPDFQKMLATQGASLPIPAGAPAYDTEYRQHLWFSRWWPIASWLAVLGLMGWVFAARHDERTLFPPLLTGVVSWRGFSCSQPRSPFRSLTICFWHPF